MPHVVFVNRYFHPDHSATSQLLSDLAFHLAGSGFEIAVLTSRQIYDEPRAALDRKETLRGVEVHRLGSTRFGRSGLAGRALDSATFHASVALELRRVARSDTIVVALTDPPLIGVTAWLARPRAARLVNWVQDLFPEVAVELGVVPRTGWVSGILRLLRDRSLRAAAANVALGEGMRAVIEASAARATVIHNWADAHAVQPVARERNALRESWGLGADFVVGYSGNLGRAHELETIVEAIRLVADDPIRFVFIGGGPLRNELEARLAESGTRDRVQFHGYQPREQLSNSLGVADAHLVLLRPELERFIVPSKFYGAAAAGRPCIFVGAADGEIPRLIREADCGVVVRSGDAAALAEGIRRLHEDRETASRMGRNARSLFEARFADSIALATWERLLASLDDENPAGC